MKSKLLSIEKRKICVMKEEGTELWFAIRTRPKAEKSVYSQFLDLGIHAFLPLITEERQWSDRKKKVIVPLISSFVFVKMEKNALGKVYSAVGVLGVLLYLGKPASIPNYEIQNLQIIIDSKADFQQSKIKKIHKGEKITIVDGPFEGLQAVYLKHYGKQKILVQLQSLKTIFEIQLPVDSVVKSEKELA